MPGSEAEGREEKDLWHQLLERFSKGLFRQMQNLQIVSSGPLDTPFLPQDLETTRRNQQVETTGVEHHMSPNPCFEWR